MGRHVYWIDRRLNAMFRKAQSDPERLEVALAGACNTLFWTTWARAREVFDLRPANLEVTPPGQAACFELPDAVGVCQVRLLPDTKSSRTIQADVIVAYQCASGLSLGKWLDRVRALREPARAVPWETDELPLFLTRDGYVWDSRYYCQQYLWPFLEEQRLEGDPALVPFDGSTEGNTIAEKFWSMHSYRRGARTHVYKTHPETLRKATPAEVNEHGRWAKKRESLDMPTLYLALPIVDRILLTLCCM
jgi:hypothetical protein